MESKEKKTKRVVICLGERDFDTLSLLALKERISISGLVRHFIIRKIYPLNGLSESDRG